MFVIHRLLRRKRDHCFSPRIPADIKALVHGSRCFYGIVRFLCRSTIRLPFPDFPCFYYVPYIDVRHKSFFRFKGDFFQNVGNRRFLLVKSPKLLFGLSFGRCHPGLTGIFRRYPLFSERSRQKKPRNVRSPLTGVTSDSWDTPAGHRVYDACRGFSVSWVCWGSGASSASSTSC